MSTFFLFIFLKICNAPSFFIFENGTSCSGSIFLIFCTHYRPLTKAYSAFRNKPPLHLIMVILQRWCSTSKGLERCVLESLQSYSNTTYCKVTFFNIVSGKSRPCLGKSISSFQLLTEAITSGNWC